MAKGEYGRGMSGGSGAYNSSLSGPTPWMVHGGQYKAANVQDATAGRVIIDPRENRMSESVNRPKGRTGLISGCKTSSTDSV